MNFPHEALVIVWKHRRWHCVLRICTGPSTAHVTGRRCHWGARLPSRYSLLCILERIAKMWVTIPFHASIYQLLLLNDVHALPLLIDPL